MWFWLRHNRKSASDSVCQCAISRLDACGMRVTTLSRWCFSVYTTYICASTNPSPRSNYHVTMQNGGSLSSSRRDEKGEKRRRTAACFPLHAQMRKGEEERPTAAYRTKEKNNEIQRSTENRQERMGRREERRPAWQMTGAIKKGNARGG